MKKNKSHIKVSYENPWDKLKALPKDFEDYFDNNPLTTPEDEVVLKKYYQDTRKDDSWIQTYSGKKFYPLNPSPDSICLEDIAHALSMQCRFTGHSSFFYSVAQHCILTSYLCHDPKDKLHALLHDASEAYLADISSPIKKLPELKGYREIEDKVQKAIYKVFGLDENEPQSVKDADLMMLSIEANSVLLNLHIDWILPVEAPPFGITPMNSKQAKELYIKRYHQLSKDI